MTDTNSSTTATVEFDSRLAARWAAFFDRIGWPYTYEPDWLYRPPTITASAFEIHGDRPLYVVVDPEKDYRQLIQKLRACRDPETEIECHHLVRNPCCWMCGPYAPDPFPDCTETVAAQ